MVPHRRLMREIGRPETTVMADYFTADAAAFLGVSPSTVRNLADAGELPHRVTPGGHRRYPEAGLIAYRGRVASVPPPDPAVAASLWTAAALAVLDQAQVHLGRSSPLCGPFQAAARILRGEEATRPTD